MNRIPLDPPTLQVESFGAEPAPATVTGDATYPDCPTATGCTCYDICQLVVRICADTVAATA